MIKYTITARWYRDKDAIFGEDVASKTYDDPLLAEAGIKSIIEAAQKIDDIKEEYGI